MWLSCLVKHLKLYSETFFKQMEKLFKIYGNQETGKLKLHFLIAKLLSVEANIVQFKTWFYHAIV